MRYLNCNNNTIIRLWRAFHCLWRIYMHKIHKKWKINKASGFFKCAEKETSFCRYYQKAANKFYRSPLSAEWQQEKKSRLCSHIQSRRAYECVFLLAWWIECVLFVCYFHRSIFTRSLVKACAEMFLTKINDLSWQYDESMDIRRHCIFSSFFWKWSACNIQSNLWINRISFWFTDFLYWFFMPIYQTDFSNRFFIPICLFLFG